MTRSRSSHREACGDQRFTIADAINVLADECRFGSSDTATVHIGQLQLPSRATVGLVQVALKQAPADRQFYVEMPTATGFTAIVARTNRREDFPIERLDEASVRESGQVTLRDGTQLRGVELIPARSPYDASDLDRKIIQATVSAIPEAEQRCYRDLFEGLPDERRRHLPPLQVLDFSTFSEKLDQPPLQVPPGAQDDSSVRRACDPGRTIDLSGEVRRPNQEKQQPDH